MAIVHAGVAGTCTTRRACKTGATVAALQAVLSTHPAGILDMEPEQHLSRQRHQAFVQVVCGTEAQQPLPTCTCEPPTWSLQ